MDTDITGSDMGIGHDNVRVQMILQRDGKIKSVTKGSGQVQGQAVVIRTGTGTL